MTGSYSGRFSLKSICMLLCVLIGMSFALQFFDVQDVQAAGTAGTVEVKNAKSWGDEGGFNVVIEDFGKGYVTIIFEFNCSANLSCSGPVKIISDGEQKCKVQFNFYR